MTKEVKKSKTQLEANTQDDNAKVNLLGEELLDEELDAVSGGARKNRSQRK